MAEKRNFALLDSKGGHSGRYSASNPSAAARRAFRQLALGKDSYSATFAIIEITQGGKGKSYEYKGSRRKLSKPKPMGGRVDKYGKPILIKHENVVVSLAGKGRGRKVLKSPAKVKSRTVSKKRSPKKAASKKASPKKASPKKASKKASPKKASPKKSKSKK